MYRKFGKGTNITEELGKDEVAHHIHYGPEIVHVLTLMGRADNDDDYDGEQFECNLCDEVVDYYGCDKCGEAFGSKSGLSGHKSSHTEN